MNAHSKAVNGPENVVNPHQKNRPVHMPYISTDDTNRTHTQTHNLTRPLHTNSKLFNEDTDENTRFSMCSRTCHHQSGI